MMNTPYTLTESTLEILKNFANINTQATFKAGTFQRACNQSRNFIADVELSDPLPVECSLYELNRLLGIIDTCKGTSLPSILFEDASLTVLHDHGRVTIPYAHADVVTKLPDNQYRMDHEIASFDLPAAMWAKMKRTAAILDANALYIIIDDDGKLQVNLVNEEKGSDSTGVATYNMPNTNIVDDKPNTWAVKFDVLQLIPGDYTVRVGDISIAGTTRQLFGMFLTLNDPTRKVTYLTSGHVVKSR